MELLGVDSYRAAKRGGITDATFRSAVQEVSHNSVYRATAADDPAFDPRLSPDTVISFLYVGGGRHNPVHLDLFTAVPKDGYLGRTQITPALGNVLGLRDKIDDKPQFLVAYGLSRSEGEWRQITFPNDTPTLRVQRTFGLPYVDKEQT